MNNLDTFVQKMYELQYSDKELNYTPEQLKQIALETGLSESEWNNSQIQLQNHVKNGREHLYAKNWDYAITEFEQAINLNPFSAENNFSLALAHFDKWKAEDDFYALGNAQKFADKSLKLKAGYSPAIQLLSKIKNSSKQSKKKNTKRNKTILIGAVGAIVLFFIIILSSYVSINNKAVGMNEDVASKWAQVENVYQRRADLIPQLIETVEAAANYEKKTLSMVVEARNNANALNIDASQLTDEQIKDFQNKQDELSVALKLFLTQSKDYPELQAVKGYRDLQAQIEGTENRISVERRRFNEQVKVYNSYIKKFPQSLFGFDDKGYFQQTGNKN